MGHIPEPDWHEGGAKCRSMKLDPEQDIFYPERGTIQGKAMTVIAKATCTGKDGKGVCPMLKSCLEFALATDEPHGIWGGKTERERMALQRKRRKAAQS